MAAPKGVTSCARGRRRERYQRRSEARSARRSAAEAAKRRAAADVRSLREARVRRRNRPRREPIPPGLYPARFTQHRIRIVSMLRRWESVPVQPDEDDTYPVRRLIGEMARREIVPKQLREFALEWPRRGFLLGLIVLACLARQAPAVRGSRREWGDLLGCSAKTAWSDLQYLVDRGWLELLPQFVEQRSHGRRGEVLHHRQRANWYRPGRKLIAAWQRYQAARAAAADRWSEGAAAVRDARPENGKVESARSSGGNDYQASAFGLRRLDSYPPTETPSPSSPLPHSADAVFDGKKVSPAAMVCLGPPSVATNGAADGRGPDACGAGKSADHEKPAQRRANMQDSFRRRPMSVEEKREIDRMSPDRSTAASLHGLYRSDPELGRDLARMLATALAKDAEVFRR